MDFTSLNTNEQVIQTSQKYDLVVLCGKFQIASIYDHPGYQYMFKEAAKISKNIFFILGRSNVRNRKNILTLEQRMTVISDYFSKELPEVSLIIQEICDHESDIEWYKNLNNLVFLRDQYKSPVYMGSRDSFLYGREMLTYPVIELESEISELSSSKVRESISRDEMINPYFSRGYIDFTSQTESLSKHNCNRDYLRGYMLGYMDENPVK